DQYRRQYQTDNWGMILARQFALTDSAFDVGQEAGPFYPTHQPILPIPWAALWLLGTAYAAWRIGDARFGVLWLWIVGGLAGAALTNDTPTLQRVAGMVPTLALVPAIFLDRVAGGIAEFRLRKSANGYSAIRNPQSAIRTGLAVNLALTWAVASMGI